MDSSPKGILSSRIEILLGAEAAESIAEYVSETFQVCYADFCDSYFPYHLQTNLSPFKRFTSMLHHLPLSPLRSNHHTS